MYYDTTLQEALSRGLKCHSNDLSKTGKFCRLIGKYLQEEYNSVFYGKAQNLGRVLCKAYDEALQKYDVLILPTIPKKAPVFPQDNPPLKGLDLFCLIVVERMWVGLGGCTGRTSISKMFRAKIPSDLPPAYMGASFVIQISNPFSVSALGSWCKALMKTKCLLEIWFRL